MSQIVSFGSREERGEQCFPFLKRETVWLFREISGRKSGTHDAVDLGGALPLRKELL
jgi:hypothetical protein